MGGGISEDDQELRDVCYLIVYVNGMLNIKTAKRIIEESRFNNIGNHPDLDEVTAYLCGTLKKFTKEQENEIIYARTKDARMLANWWEEHQKLDALRDKK